MVLKFSVVVSVKLFWLNELLGKYRLVRFLDLKLIIVVCVSGMFKVVVMVVV